MSGSHKTYRADVRGGQTQRANDEQVSLPSLPLLLHPRPRLPLLEKTVEPSPTQLQYHEKTVERNAGQNRGYTDNFQQAMPRAQHRPPDRHLKEEPGGLRESDHACNDGHANDCDDWVDGSGNADDSDNKPNKKNNNNNNNKKEKYWDADDNCDDGAARYKHVDRNCYYDHDYDYNDSNSDSVSDSSFDADSWWNEKKPRASRAHSSQRRQSEQESRQLQHKHQQHRHESWQDQRREPPRKYSQAHVAFAYEDPVELNATSSGDVRYHGDRTADFAVNKNNETSKTNDAAIPFIHPPYHSVSSSLLSSSSLSLSPSSPLPQPSTFHVSSKRWADERKDVNHDARNEKAKSDDDGDANDVKRDENHELPRYLYHVYSDDPDIYDVGNPNDEDEGDFFLGDDDGDEDDPSDEEGVAGETSDTETVIDEPERVEARYIKYNDNEDGNEREAKNKTEEKECEGEDHRYGFAIYSSLSDRFVRHPRVAEKPTGAAYDTAPASSKITTSRDSNADNEAALIAALSQKRAALFASRVAATPQNLSKFAPLHQPRKLPRNRDFDFDDNDFDNTAVSAASKISSGDDDSSDNRGSDSGSGNGNGKGNGNGNGKSESDNSRNESMGNTKHANAFDKNEAVGANNYNKLKDNSGSGGSYSNACNRMPEDIRSCNNDHNQFAHRYSANVTSVVKSASTSCDSTNPPRRSTGWGMFADDGLFPDESYQVPEQGIVDARKVYAARQRAKERLQKRSAPLWFLVAFGCFSRFP